MTHVNIDAYALLKSASKSFLGHSCILSDDLHLPWTEYLRSAKAKETFTTFELWSIIFPEIGWGAFNQRDSSYVKMYRDYCARVCRNADDWTLVFFFYKAIVDLSRFSAKPYLLDAGYFMLREFRSYLEEKHISFETFVHMLHLWMQPQFSALPDSLLNFTFSILYPNLGDVRSALKNMQPVALMDRLSKKEQSMLRIASLSNSTFLEVWQRFEETRAVPEVDMLEL